MLRFLATPRWIALTIFAVAVGALCVRLGVWQLDRLEGRRTTNERLEAGMALPPEPVERLVAEGDPAAVASRLVTASGRYDAGGETVLYGRPLAGRPGNHVLTPLVLADGRAVIVDRGWVPFEPIYPPVEASAPPAGGVEISGVLVVDAGAGQDAVVESDDGRITVLSRVDLQALADQLPYELLPVSITLRAQTPAQGELPVPEPLPALDDGPHLGYALQWFVFATIAAIGWVVLVRREALDRRRADAPDRQGHATLEA